MTVNKKNTGRKKAPPKKRAASTVKRRQKNNPVLADYFIKNGQLKNPRHEMYSQAWVQSFRHEFAIEEAGYPFKDKKEAQQKSCHLLQREEIQVRVRAILVERVRDMALTESWIVLELLDTYQKCSAMVSVFDHEGNPTGDKNMSDSRTALRALEMLGQNMGMFKTKGDAPAQNITLNLNYGVAPEPKLLVGEKVIEGVSKRLQ